VFKQHIDKDWSLDLDVEHLFKRYNAMVLRRCRQLLKDEARAMDAMQDVFVKLMERKDSLTDDAPSSMLYRIATNHCLNIIRDNKKYVQHDFSNSEHDDESERQNILFNIANASDSTEQLVASNILDKLFRRHPESTRTIAVLHYYDGMTLDEVAEHVGMSVSGIRKRLRQLKSSLQAFKE